MARNVTDRVATAVLATLLVGCGATHSSPVVIGQPPDPCTDAAEQQKVEALLSARQHLRDAGAGYAVSVGDVLGVTVYNYRPGGGDFSSEVRVDDRGDISLPMMDPVRVAGLSIGAARRAVVAALQRADVLKEPLVSVFVKDYLGQEVIVLGAVAQPGIYHLSRGKQTLIDVLSRAGGLRETAGNFLFLRPARRPAPPKRFSAESSSDVEPDNLLVCFDTETGEPDPTLLKLRIRGGDLIIVPESGKAYIDGAVKNPGPYALTRGMTLTQLVSTAGGLTFPADPQRVKVVRQSAGKTIAWETSIAPTESEVQPDIRLSRNDHVSVPAMPVRKVAYQFYTFVTDIVRITIGGAASIF